MRAHVLVLGIALVGGAVAFLGLVEPALAEVDVGELQVQVRLVEVMDVGLKLLDAPAVAAPGSSKPASGLPDEPMLGR
ncbi:MAG: hypothetical protein WDO13_10650 [Verrucomicrobiota bacterium]